MKKVKTAPARKPPAKKKPAAAAQKKKKKAKPAAPARRPPTRADLGAPIEGWFARQPQPQRSIAEALHALVMEAAPDAVGALKWGMPFYTSAGGMMCAIAAHKAHVNLIMVGKPESFADPEGILQGDAKGGRHLKLESIDELPKKAVRGWLKTAAATARAGGKMR